MKSPCDTIMEANSLTWSCKETENGTRVRTTCVFPSFEPIFVYVVKFGDGFVVHDAGETMAVILVHGQDGDVARKVIRSECRRFGLEFGKRRISLKIAASEWLDTAIVAVANAAAMAARAAMAETARKSEKDLAEVLFSQLKPKVSKGAIFKDFPHQGKSGRNYIFDLAIQSGDDLMLIEAVTAHPNSVNAKYIALANVPLENVSRKIVAHNGDLSCEDTLLFQNVATVAVPSGVMEIVTGRHA